MASKLQHYLRTHRKRAGFTETELAQLLGCKSAAKVSRYERFERLPSLKTALAYQAILGVPVAKLFAGMYEQVEKEASKRAKELARKLERSGQMSTRKRDLLRAIEITPSINKENS
jgi:transcriptional regulator with XRE-family HTH domain